jgi:soluble lytic murein transglycosylase
VASVAIAMASTFALAACARHESPSPAIESTAAKVGDAGREAAALSLAVESVAAPSAGGPWAEAIRLEKWDEAWRALEALDPAEQAKAEVRYARARVALARGDGASARAPLDGLEKDLPLLVDDVRHYRAEAQLVAGPFEEAGEYFLSRGNPQSLVKAAQAFERAKLPARARAACDRLLAQEHRTRAQEADAHAIVVRLAAPGDVTAADDARWLAVKAPDLPAGKDAEASLLRLDPKKPLTTDELLARAQVLADAARAEEALRALEQVDRAPGRKVPTLERLRARGDVLFRARTRYLDAARALNEAAAAGGPHAAEDAFHAARALARADHDDEAISAMVSVARHQGRTTWGDQASFFVGRLHLLHGRWQAAAKALDEYARVYPNGLERRDAARDRAIAHLMSDDHAVARKLFEQLAEDEPDTLAAARARNMAALAAMRDGDRMHAVARWIDVARSRPLSWPSMVARARLTSVGMALPPLIDPADPLVAGDAGGAPEPLAVALPPPVDILHRIGLDADAEVALRDREGLVTAAAPARSVEALCAAYGQLGRAKRRYQIAQQIPAALLATAPTLRTRWSWECAYPHPYELHVREDEAREGLPDGLVYAVMRQESGFDPDAVSSARAVGLLQLLPETARQVAEGSSAAHDDARLTSPPYNIALGASYLHDLLDKFHGTVPLAVAAYNAGPESVSRWLGRPKGMDVDVFVERIPFSETRAYAARVMGNLARYGYLQKGDAGVPVLSLRGSE